MAPPCTVPVCPPPPFHSKALRCAYSTCVSFALFVGRCCARRASACGLLSYFLRRSGQDLAHYALATTDLEYKFPFGWDELWGIANRGSYDLQCHSEGSGIKLTYEDPHTKEVRRGNSFWWFVYGWNWVGKIVRVCGGGGGGGGGVGGGGARAHQTQGESLMLSRTKQQD